MRCRALQLILAWVEDRATQRCDPSAVQAAKTEERTAAHAAVRPAPLRDWPQSAKPSRHDAANSSTGCRSSLANAGRSEFQFTVNQYSSSRAMAAMATCGSCLRLSASPNCRSECVSYPSHCLLRVSSLPSLEFKHSKYSTARHDGRLYRYRTSARCKIRGESNSCLTIPPC